MRVPRQIGQWLFLTLENVLIGCKIFIHGPDDISFATQAMRLLMFCARYLDLVLVRYNFFLKLSLVLSTLVVVMLLGYKKCRQGAHRNISHETIRDVIVILLLSQGLGAAFMVSPAIPEFFWTSSRFIDVVVEVPQLKIVYASDKLDKWIIAYYCCIGFQVLSYTWDLIYRFLHWRMFDMITSATTISKGVGITIFFIVRFFIQRKRRLAEGLGGPALGPDKPCVSA